jgi:hypothetical protein
MELIYWIALSIVCLTVMIWQRFIMVKMHKQNKERENLMKVAVFVSDLETELIKKQRDENNALKKELADLKTAMRKI